jgi:hypothetical protein
VVDGLLGGHVPPPKPDAVAAAVVVAAPAVAVALSGKADVATAAAYKKLEDSINLFVGTIGCVFASFPCESDSEESPPLLS